MLEVKNLTKIYKKENRGIRDISFNLKKGEIIAFVGDNGAGKTTTMKAIFNELKINSGEVLLDGENIFKNKNLNRIAFFPDTISITFNARVIDYIKYNGIVIGLKISYIEKRIAELFDFLKLTTLKNQKLKTLSGGERKKVILASILLNEPEFIFFDEPTANLDVKSKIEFIKILKSLSNNNIGLLITSHILEELQQLANKLILLDAGKIMFCEKIDNTKDDILSLYLKHTKNLDSNFDASKIINSQHEE